MVRRSVNNSCCCIWKWPWPLQPDLQMLLFFWKNVHNTCYNFTCICPKMQKCISRGPNYKNLIGGARSCAPTPMSCLWLARYTPAAYYWSFAAYSDSYWKPWTSHWIKLNTYIYLLIKHVAVESQPPEPSRKIKVGLKISPYFCWKNLQ